MGYGDLEWPGSGVGAQWERGEEMVCTGSGAGAGAGAVMIGGIVVSCWIRSVGGWHEDWSINATPCYLDGLSRSWFAVFSVCVRLDSKFPIPY